MAPMYLEPVHMQAWPTIAKGDDLQSRTTWRLTDAQQKHVDLLPSIKEPAGKVSEKPVSPDGAGELRRIWTASTGASTLERTWGTLNSPATSAGWDAPIDALEEEEKAEPTNYGHVPLLYTYDEGMSYGTNSQAWRRHPAKQRRGLTALEQSESVPALSTKAAGPKPAAGPSGHKAFPVAFLPSSLPAFAVAPEAKPRFKQANFDEFWERQQTHQSFARRRDVNRYIRRRAKLATEKEAKAQLGASDVNGFIKDLERRYGNVARAWRLALDVDGNGRLAQNEFYAAVREICYNGNVQSLWKALDEDEGGFITLDELDSVAYQELTAFRELLETQFGTTMNAWRKGLDLEQMLKVYKNDFFERVTAMGYTGDVKQLFKYLSEGDEKPYITLEDLDPAAYERFISGAPEPEPFAKPRPKPSERKNLPFYERQETESLNNLFAVSKLQREALKEKNYWARYLDLGATNLKGFIHLLKVKCQNIPRGWRQLLDKDGNGRLCRQEFYQALREMSYCGSMKLLWDELDDDGSGFIEMQELDPEAAEGLEKFRQLLIEKYGNTLRGYRQGLDVDRNNRIDRDEFKDRCAELGYDGDSAKLFEWLTPEASRTYLNMEDVDPKAWHAYQRGDHSMLTEASSTKAGLAREAAKESPRGSAKSGEGVRRGTATSLRNEQVAKQHIAFLRAKEKQAKAADLGASTKEGFKHLLVQHYGNSVRAWRYALDTSGDGKLSRNEFYASARAVSYNGNLKQLWDDLDDDASGFITLGEFELDAHLLIEQFREAVHRKFGEGEMGFLKFWVTAMDLEGRNAVDSRSFAERLVPLGIRPSEGRKLFNYFSERQGAQFISLTDIDKRAGTALRRGDRELYGIELPKKIKPKIPLTKGYEGMTSSTLRCRELSIEDRKEMKRKAEVEAARDCGLSNSDGFIAMLQSRFGSVAAGWRMLLDPEDRGKVSRAVFYKAARDMGFTNDIRSLWEKLDDDHSMTITLQELDEDAALAIKAIKEAAAAKHGNALKAWINGMDLDKSGRLDKDEFVEVMKRLECKGNADYIFKQLLLCPAERKFVCLDDWDRAAYFCHLRDDTEMVTVSGSKLERSNFEGQKARQKEEAARKAEQESLMGASNRKGFDLIMRQLHGNIVCGWRNIFDPDQKGRTSKADFFRGCREIGFAGDSRKFWNTLDDDNSGFISLGEIHPQAHIGIESFRKLLDARFGTPAIAWRDFLDKDRSGRLELHEFVTACAELGYDGDAKQLFIWMRMDHNAKFMSLTDIDKHAATCMAAGDWDMVAIRGTAQERRKAVALAMRHAIQQARLDREAADSGARTVDGLKQLLRGKYGTVAAGWRNVFDPKDLGRVSERVFFQACQSIGYAGALGACWKQLGPVGGATGGFLRLENIDPQAAEATHDFKTALGKACGNLCRGWRKKLDVDNSLRVELGEFVEGCKAIGYTKSPKKAFRSMQRDPGKPFLFIEDFDKDAAKAMKDEDLDMDFTPSPYTFWAQGDVDAKQRWTEVRDVVRKGGSLLRTITKNAEERRDGADGATPGPKPAEAPGNAAEAKPAEAPGNAAEAKPAEEPAEKPAEVFNEVPP